MSGLENSGSINPVGVTTGSAMTECREGYRPEEGVARAQIILSHAWMVRTFVKHSPEIEEFPELMGIVRSVFDLCRAVESRVGDPQAYLQFLRKKLPKLREAAVQFSIDAPLASDHTNFCQAVISITGCVEELQQILNHFPQAAPPPMPAGFSRLRGSGTLELPAENPDLDEPTN